MTVRERLHKKIDQLDDRSLSRLAEALEGVEASRGREAQRTEETIALWEAFAEPMEDEAAEREMLEAMECRPLFGGRELEVDPD